MKKIQILTGVLCLLAATFLFVFDFSELHFMTGPVTVNVYPAIVFTVVGIALVASAHRRERAGH
jgi:TRAP-type uncharacterized transport system fused permease subunit